MMRGRRRALVLVGLLGIAGSLGACATSGPRAEWHALTSLYASGAHLEFSLGTPPGAVSDVPELEEYDPWEPYNERMFAFNRKVDRFVLEPAARAWSAVVPPAVQRGLGRAFTNLGMPRRLVNGLLQLRGDRALREVTRFVVNGTAGVAGLFDVAAALGLESREADTGQTLGVYGIGPGPYLIVPVLPPLTLRDGFGLAVDLALDPLNYLLPFVATASLTGGRIVNERALALEQLEEIEKDLLDPYAAARNAYLQLRRKLIQEALQDSFRE
jgi:phospholipid-binding lipoprotein MlaA